MGEPSGQSQPGIRNVGRLSFGESCGLVSTQNGSSPARLWATSSRGSRRKIGRHKNDQGAAKLLDMCWRTILVNLADLDSESVRGLPWEIGRRLWQKIRANDLISIHMWQMFVREYQDDITEIPDLMLHANSPRILPFALQSHGNTEELTPYLAQITTPTFEWITLLSLFDVSLPRQDWIRLKKLTNLGGLFVQNSSTLTHLMDDVVFKAWGNAAQEEGAFPKLKVALLRNQPRLTTGIVEYLQHCPEMRLVHMTGPTLTNEVAKHSIAKSRWLWLSQSKLCLKMFGEWFAAKSIEGRVRAVYDTICREDSHQSETRRKPILDVTSGQDPTRRIAGEQDQLWFELKAKTEEENEAQKEARRRRQEKREDEEIKHEPKKLTMRSGVAKALPDLLATFRPTR